MKERGQSTHSQGGTGENTPFAKQSRKKERDNGRNNGWGGMGLTSNLFCRRGSLASLKDFMVSFKHFYNIQVAARMQVSNQVKVKSSAPKNLSPWHDLEKLSTKCKGTRF